MKEKEKYFYVLLLFIVIIIACFLFNKFYVGFEKTSTNQVLNEMNKNEIEFYMKDMANAMILVGRDSDFKTEKVKKVMVKFAKNYDYSENIVYLNLSNEKNIDKYLKNFEKKYNSNEKFEAIPSIVMIINREIYDIYNFNQDNKINYKRIEKFFDKYKKLVKEK